MKKKNGAVFALMLLGFVITGIFLVLLPEQVPMHYNAAGEVDRFGSKYETLVYPLLTALTGISFLLLARYQRKHRAEANEKVLTITAIVLLVCLNAMTVYFLVKALTFEKTAAALDTVETIRFMAIVLGVVQIVMGNIMPKATLNAVFGLRTKWSMANARVWQKSQRFCGYSSIICGFLLLLGAILFEEMSVTFFLIGLMLIWVIACVVASYRIYQKDKAAGLK